VKTYFLSYARADSAIALKLADDLKAAGTSVWVDQYDIHPSQHWDRAVEDAVRGCEGMIVVLSPRSTASPNVADEVSVAIDSGKTVIPVLVEACTLPLRMTRMQFIDAREDYAEALRRCLAALSAEGGPGPAGPTASAPPRQDDLIAEDVAAITRALTHQIGPIAPQVVSRERPLAASRADLCRRLSLHIPAERDRQVFLKAVETS
jgi:hypothetical protein